MNEYESETESREPAVAAALSVSEASYLSVRRVGR